VRRLPPAQLRERLGKTASTEKSVELKFSIPDAWSRQLLIALCRRYGMRPYRHPRMHRQSIMIKATQSFMEQVLWPEFRELSAALVSYLSEITDKVIREEVHGETDEADEIDEPARIGRSDQCNPQGRDGIAPANCESFLYLIFDRIGGGRGRVRASGF